MLSVGLQEHPEGVPRLGAWLEGDRSVCDPQGDSCLSGAGRDEEEKVQQIDPKKPLLLRE